MASTHFHYILIKFHLENVKELICIVYFGAILVNNFFYFKFLKRNHPHFLIKFMQTFLGEKNIPHQNLLIF